MQVHLHKATKAEPFKTDVDLRDAVPAHDLVEARYNLEKYGRYWSYDCPMGDGEAVLLMRVIA